VSLAGLGYTAAIVLAGLLVVAAVAKAVAPDETRRSFQALGVPNPDSAARLVPLPEFAAAVLLVVVPAVGGIATLMLLAFFSTFILTRLRAGVVAPCACFGATSAQPLSWLAIARNAAMAVLAIAALATLHPVRPTVADVVVVVGYVVVVGAVLQVKQRSLAA
jgi:hypothetical protein